MNRTRWLAVAVVLGLYSAPGSARADLVTINFSGPVTLKTDPFALVPSSFGAVGTTISGVLQYDTTVAPLASGPGLADYPFTNFSMTLNGTTLPGLLSLGYDVTVINQLFLASLHAGGVLTDPGLFPHFSGGNISFDLTDGSGVALSSTNLPTNLSLSAFLGRTLQINLQATDPGTIAPSVVQNVEILGTINNLSVNVTKPKTAPEPASCLLFGIGLVGTAGLARQRGRRRASGT
jgi:hypothetical protein